MSQAAGTGAVPHDQQSRLSGSWGRLWGCMHSEGPEDMEGKGEKRSQNRRAERVPSSNKVFSALAGPLLRAGGAAAFQGSTGTT